MASEVAPSAGAGGKAAGAELAELRTGSFNAESPAKAVDAQFRDLHRQQLELFLQWEADRSDTYYLALQKQTYELEAIRVRMRQRKLPEIASFLAVTLFCICLLVIGQRSSAAVYF